MSNSVAKTSPKYNVGSADAILDTAKTVYNEEADRFKQVEAKTSMTIAFISVLFGAFLTYLGTFNPISENTWYLIYTYFHKFIILSLLSISTIYFFRSIKVGEHRQIDLDSVVDAKYATDDEALLKLRLASTYKEVVDSNCSKIDLKLKNYNRGLFIMVSSFVVFVVHFIVEEVIKNVH